MRCRIGGWELQRVGSPFMIALDPYPLRTAALIRRENETPGLGTLGQTRRSTQTANLIENGDRGRGRRVSDAV